MKRLRLWSPNLQSIILELIKNQRLCKLIHYNNENPLEQPDILKPSSLIMKNIFPYPFDLETTDSDCVQLRISYPELNIKHRVIENTDVLFEVVMSKNLWSISTDSETALRPFEILSEILDQLADKSIEKVGRLNFLNARFVKYNSKFNGYELTAVMETIGTGRKK
ncbi:hypothetical protein [Brevibacillus laterosporus]|uniref:Uncharacterized protein n=1 Tax=Brevibacillus laterosporus TaxID=1465 RepID=A0A518VCN2_BRELA|nr:hypothetical protein [Brevibacillus laterosporus]MED1665776.1 hypothetical protein [Brevibacillus laterosporus]MED1667135.1 hypothetical protein [Brevibacillus laterosporus]MED1719797.1 hypothetical protein [Brevibacillus laterosporus]QDX94750.1 hypothetical protein EEL30_22165 [Brevibacillus laterosporus]